MAQIHVDFRSGVEIIYEHYFLCFDRDIRDKLEEDSVPLVGFNNIVSHPLGKIKLPFTVGVGDIVRTIELVFSVVRAPSKYNAILRKTGNRRTLGTSVNSPWSASLPNSQRAGLGKVFLRSNIIGPERGSKEGTKRGRDRRVGHEREIP